MCYTAPSCPSTYTNVGAGTVRPSGWASCFILHMNRHGGGADEASTQVMIDTQAGIVQTRGDQGYKRTPFLRVFFGPALCRGRGRCRDGAGGGLWARGRRVAVPRLPDCRRRSVFEAAGPGWVPGTRHDRIGPQPHPSFIEVSGGAAFREARGRWRERGNTGRTVAPGFRTPA